VSKLLALFVAATFITGTVGLAVAQAPAPEKKMEKSGEKSGDMKKSDGKMKKPAAKNANGTVKSASADSIVVAGKEKGKEAEWTFGVDSKTMIKKGGKSITAGDLKAGDAVHVRYSEADGKAVAQAVTVKAGGTAKKAEKKAANPCAAKNPCAPKK